MSAALKDSLEHRLKRAGYVESEIFLQRKEKSNQLKRAYILLRLKVEDC